jgi:DNA (cytosine-5)-methyltransferase 1
LDFFGGSGLVAEALKSYFTPIWANDICPKKAEVFCANHPRSILRPGPIQSVRGDELPDAILSWASFPCQDLSLAGPMQGIDSPRSGLVWEWLRVMDEMPRRPPILVAENVAGLVSALGGEHYRTLHWALVRRGYRVGAVLFDAARWLPQSRPRVFVIAVVPSLQVDDLVADGPTWAHPSPVQRAARGLDRWLWWRIQEPRNGRRSLVDVIDFEAPCDDPETAAHNLGLIPPRHRRRLKAAAAAGLVRVVPGYKRTRNGRQSLELRFDGIAGCLRTPEGGSSRQLLVLVKNGKFTTRLLTVREAARLMGVRESYKIPGGYNNGYRAMGDAVAVPVVRHLAKTLLHPLALRVRG